MAKLYDPRNQCTIHLRIIVPSVDGVKQLFLKWTFGLFIID